MDVEVVLDDVQRGAAAVLDETARRLQGGVYLWGPVGRGKSMLMDRFFDSVRVPKRRVHFHDFLGGLYADAHLLDGCRLLCFDEFHVHDVGDATLVARLLRQIAERGITLVVTSNYPPTGLLPNPLFHHVFEPSIGWIERNLTVVAVHGPIDYRRQGVVNARDARFASGAYVLDANLPDTPHRTVRPGNRAITALAVSGREIWFDFGGLCRDATAASDYLTLAETYDCWTISAVPRLRDTDPNAIRRFGNLVDVLYDKNVRLTLVAAAPLHELVEDAWGHLDVERLVSRLSLLRQEPCASEPADAVDVKL